MQLTHILIVPSHAASHSTASPGCVVLCWGAQESKANPIWSDPLGETAGTCHPQAAGGTSCLALAPQSLSPGPWGNNGFQTCQRQVLF